jgi:uncharacterized protein YraI
MCVKAPARPIRFWARSRLATPIRVLGKNEAGDWWQIDTGNGSGWVINQLVDASGAVDAVAVITDIPEPVVAAAAAPG